MHMHGQLNLVIAHFPEAKPLLSWFALAETNPRGKFRCFANDSGMSLVVTGAGVENAAAGVEFLHQRLGGRPGAWLNIGIAGHGAAPVGEGLLIQRIEHRATGKRYWPPAPKLKLPGSSLITVSTPETAYAEAAAYDMEAAGFFASASRLAPADLIAVYKIVSDNPEHPLASLNLRQVPDLIGARETGIRRLVDHLRGRSARFADWHSLPPEFESLLGKYHFSATRKAAFARACRRFRALGIEPRLSKLARGRHHNAATLMAALEAELATANNTTD